MTPKRLIAPLIAGSLLLAACGDDDNEPAASGDDTGDETDDSSAEPADEPADEPAEDVTLVVWDFKSGDPAFQPFFETLEDGFEADHPGVDIEFVAQPVDQYYTLVGTAAEAEDGPDVVLFNAGTDIQDRTDALLALDGAVADMRDQYAGWSDFSTADGTFAVPMTVQGITFYYNKAIYEAAGLDPEQPPTTWDEFDANCAAIMENTDASCISVGNKEGWAVDWFFTIAAPSAFDEAQYTAWLDGEQNFSSPEATAILERWKTYGDDGFYSNGPNATAMFPDQFSIFERGDAAHTMGLISDVAHWKEFEEFLGADVGIMLPPATEAGGDTFLPAGGGIGFAVTAWTDHADLATEFVKYTVAPAPAQALFDGTGAIVSDTEFDASATDSPNVPLITGWLADSRTPAHNVIPTEVRAELERQGQNMLNGTSVADAIGPIEALQS